jgi:SAM-dependent methyltransferase
MWGVDTCGSSAPAEVNVVGQNWRSGGRYQGCDADILDGVLRELPISHSECAFIDLGSGKGRAILVASRFEFARVIGVEYSKDLSDIAERNIQRFPASERRCREIQAICGDAVEFPLPGGPLVIYLYNSFGANLMELVRENVRKALEAAQRRVVLLYFNPVHVDIWDNARFLRKVRVEERLAVFDSEGSVPKKDVRLEPAG